MLISDKELLESICNTKDMAAFKVFYDRYANLLYSWANKRTGSKDISDDVVQNFWIIFWSNPSVIKVNQEGTARAYLMRYFYFRMYDYLQSAANEVLGDSKLFEPISDTRGYSHIFEELEVSEILEVIDGIVASLPETYRDIFRYIWEEDHSVKAAGEHFNLSEKVIRTRYNKVISSVQSKIIAIDADEQKLQNIRTLMYCMLCSELFR
ncbi:sigma-70 family RNA polymerase sigma factor [uncultured Flavobacterium sp.]|uniref:RNA polymerase sigma factor n=1 Tax=uncultured Flavobacterium sp. TaxID=165435 RepID=UPI0025D21A77|nr:sigma-70 family RNA polymerase sigma factor [uncultured Flavobacterium sp.]